MFTTASTARGISIRTARTRPASQTGFPECEQLATNIGEPHGDVNWHFFQSGSGEFVYTPAFLSRHPATEAGRFFRFALAVVCGEERVWTQRTCAPGEGAAAGDDAFRSFVFLYPSLDRSQCVEVIQPGSAAAMIHAGSQKETREIPHLRVAAVVLADLAVKANQVVPG